ncbi:MAG: hypothetical protein KAX38_04985 [Candidatus Krumholzibacteria bacterium]|nr:hypothetical protein [Candidatus Krumholzibacteria bacterium]
MPLKRMISVVLMISLCTLVIFSCAKEKKEPEKAPPEGEKKTISYINENVSFGIYFDEEGTKRTITLGADEKEFKAHVIVKFPEEMEITAVEYRLVFPDGVELENDKFYSKRMMTLGTFESGISESFPCIAGPKLVIHTLTLKVTKELKNAELAVLSSLQSDVVGVATCEEGNPLVRSIAYRAVINPVE